jgi:methionyl-tRNA formyltransferase/RimJ/RimL family protein N-acetyltransferase
MRILLFGDIPGIPQLLRHIPVEHLVGIVGAAIRPQYHTALAAIAESHALQLLIQPKMDSADYANFSAAVTQLEPDLIWVNSYSMILRQDVLCAARLGGINIHGALLPQYRGCNPTQWAILNGEAATGVTMHEMSGGLDEGAIIEQRVVPLFFEDTWQTAYARISIATDELIAANLHNILAEDWQAKKQDISQANYCRRRTPEDGLFDWSQPVVDIYNKIRALLPPLPPAFHIDTAGGRVHMDQQLTPFGVTALKYGPEGGGDMVADRVRLRPLRKEDSALLYQWITHRELVILNAPFYPVSEAAHESWIESMLTKSMDLVIFVIEELEASQAIGTCQLLNINWLHHSAELQIRIGDAPYQDRGFGSEAVTLLSHFGFSDLNLHRIYLHVFSTNTRAINTYKKCGFAQEGLLKEAAFIDGAWVDVVVMARVNQDE